jgi:hypothetical protein
MSLNMYVQIHTNIMLWRQMKIYSVSREEVHKLKEMIYQPILNKSIA